MFKKHLATSLFAASLAVFSSSAFAAPEEYVIDTEGAHAFIQFKIKHIGISWLLGEFDKFTGEFTYDAENPSASKVSVNIDAASLNSNHAERDKHLRGKDFFDVKKYPTAKFVSTAYKAVDKETAILTGDLTLRGITKSVTIDVKHTGAGNDPWGGYRRGFEGSTRITLKDFGITYNLGDKAREAELSLFVEGIKK